MVVAFIPTRFVMVEELEFTSSPPYKDVRPENAAVPEAKMPPEAIIVAGLKVVTFKFVMVEDAPFAIKEPER